MLKYNADQYIVLLQCIYQFLMYTLFSNSREVNFSTVNILDIIFYDIIILKLRIKMTIVVNEYNDC